MKNTRVMGLKSGFALPTVLIASIVMLIVLLSGLVAASSTNTALKQQYYGRLNKEAVESGYARAQSCLNIYGRPTWSTASPLRPDSSCTGGPQCNTGPACYVLSNSSIKTTFTVNTATQNSDGSYNIPVVGEVQFLRTSDGSINSNLSLKDDRPMKTRMGWNMIAMGTSHSCGITVNERAYCWGYGATSGIGNGMSNPSSVTVPYPVARGQIPLGVSLVSVVSNNSWSSHCALGSDGEAYCWGSNAHGQLGNNTTVDSNVPVQVVQGAVPAGVTFTSIQIGFYYACALGTDSKVYCWGDNQFGSLGNNSTVSSSVPVLASAQGQIPAGVTAKSLAIGFYTSCIIGSNNWVYCWGYNATSQFGTGNSTNSLTPIAISQGAVPNGVNWKYVSVGVYHSCGITTSDTAFCWGDTHSSSGNYYALGNGTTTVTNKPSLVAQGATPPGSTWRALAVGDNVSCGIATDNKAYCWGLNGSAGALGNNSTSPSNVPVAVAQGDMPSPTTTLVGISVGSTTPCALDSLGIGYCWGEGVYGELGNGAVANSSGPNALTPTRLRTPTEQGLLY